MKALYQVSDKLSFEVEAENPQEMFKELAMVQDIFDQESPGGGEVIYRVRRDKDENEYYECVDSKNFKLKLHFGVNKKGGGLFPKRLDDNKMDGLVRKGWHWVEWVGTGNSGNSNDGDGGNGGSSGSTPF